QEFLNPRSRRPKSGGRWKDRGVISLPMISTCAAFRTMKGAGPGSSAHWNCLGRPSKRDPDYGPALALPPHCHHVLDIIGWTKDRAANRSECVDLARRALGVAKADPDVLGRVAFAFGYFGEDLDAAIALIERAKELNPNFALGWFRSGVLRL